MWEQTVWRNTVLCMQEPKCGPETVSVFCLVEWERQLMLLGEACLLP